MFIYSHRSIKKEPETGCPWLVFIPPREANSSLNRPAGVVYALILIESTSSRYSFALLRVCTHDIILGLDILTVHNALIDGAEDKLYISELTNMINCSPSNITDIYMNLLRI